VELHETRIDMRISKIERRERYSIYAVLDLDGGAADQVQIGITRDMEAASVSGKEVTVRAFDSLGKQILCAPTNPGLLPEAGKGKCSTAFANFILENHDPKVIRSLEVSYAGGTHKLEF
jgi:hypothetical protein